MDKRDVPDQVISYFSTEAHYVAHTGFRIFLAFLQTKLKMTW